MTVLQRLAPRARVAVIRLRSLGDCVLTTPALALLSSARPDLEIGVAVESRFAAIFSNHPSVQKILDPSISSVRRFQPDLCLNLHGGSRSMWMTALSGATIRAGFGHHKGASIYNVSIPSAQAILHVDQTVHTAEHLASAIFYLGAPIGDVPRATLYAAPWPHTSSYAVIHAVAATAEKTWPSANFISLARYLHREHGLEPIFIGGPGDDLSPFSEFRAIADAPLEETKSILRSAALFVGNDSGPAHMAAAFGVPVVVLFGPSDPVIWAPWRTNGEVLCDKAGIARLQVADVVSAVNRLKVRA